VVVRESDALLWRGDLVARATAAPHASCAVNFATPDDAWHVVVRDGVVVAAGSGEIEHADLAVSWDRDDAASIAAGHLAGNAALLRTTVHAPGDDGSYVGPPAPLNLRARPEINALPRIPHADVTVQYRYRNGPFGDVAYSLTFVDGRLELEQLAESDDADVVVEVSFRAMAEVRAGEMSILDAIADGTVQGDEGALGLLAGISESREFHRAELATGRHAIALAALGELRASLSAGTETGAAG